MPSIARARREFAAATNWTYLDTSSTGIMPARTAEAVRRFVDDCAANAATKSEWAAALDGARSAFARLLNAAPEDVALCGNTTEGVSFVTGGLPWERGDNVVLCGELEHPAIIYPWLGARERGLEVRMVPAKELAIDVDALCGEADSRTRAISVSTVTFVPGFRTDLDRLGRFCRERGIFLLVDATQSLGALHTDVQALPIDGLSVSTHKYLLAFYGMGAFWCRREWARRMRPAQIGKPGLEDADEHPGANGYRLNLKGDARRFETRHLYVGAAALRASCEYLLEIGTREIEAHVTGLARRFVDGLGALGLAVNRDPFGLAPTQVVTVGPLTRDGLHTTSDPLLKRVHDHLAANRVRLSARRGMLRFSFHLYNSEDDVTRLLALIEEATGRAGARRRAAAGG
ncbi:MAG: aminotransferase class V-fold PLP-dependent enzyme [Proteobacteria bacterium]|nr:aminotransferase class V-fold PLP-dependent enzyme [Pseudomonadota bacterium]